MYEVLGLTRIIPEGNSTYTHTKMLRNTVLSPCETEPSQDPSPTLQLRGPKYTSWRPQTPQAPWQSSCQEKNSFSFQSNYCDSSDRGKIAHGFPFGNKPLKKKSYLSLVKIVSILSLVSIHSSHLREFARLNVYVTPKLISWNLIDQCDGIWKWGFGEVIRQWECTPQAWD